MDPAEERKDMEKKKEYLSYLGCVADGEYGIPTRCPCGGSIIDEVRLKGDVSTHPGKRFFTCKNFEDDGLHYRQPWVFGVQEEIERLIKRVEEAKKVMMRVPELESEIANLKAQVGILNGQVDVLNAQVSLLEKLNYE